MDTTGSVTAPVPAAATGQPAARTKSKAYQTTIAAEADDLKYESKYKELKKKVKEVEEDNEQLHVKILQARQSIQRLRLERALIYERLATLTPPPVPAHQPVTTHGNSGQAHSSHSHHAHSAPGNSVTSTPHQPHPLSQSFTPQRDYHSNASANGSAQQQNAYQYSPSMRQSHDRALPSMKTEPLEAGRPHNVLPPISPAGHGHGYHEGRIPHPEVGDRDRVGRSRYSPGPYTSSNPSHSIASRRESYTHSAPQYPPEEPYHRHGHGHDQSHSIPNANGNSYGNGTAKQNQSSFTHTSPISNRRSSLSQANSPVDSYMRSSTRLSMDSKERHHMDIDGDGHPLPPRSGAHGQHAMESPTRGNHEYSNSKLYERQPSMEERQSSVLPPIRTPQDSPMSARRMSLGHP